MSPIKEVPRLCRILPTRLDKCLQPAVAMTIEQLNMRLPEDGANVRGKAQENIMYRVKYNRCIQGWFRRRQLYERTAWYIYITYGNNDLEKDARKEDLYFMYC